MDSGWEELEMSHKFIYGYAVKGWLTYFYGQCQVCFLMGSWDVRVVKVPEPSIEQLQDL